MKKGVNFEFGQDVFAVDHQAQHITVKCRPSPENVRANAEDVLEIQADAIVVCAGVGSYQLADLLGERVNVYPVKAIQLRYS